MTLPAISTDPAEPDEWGAQLNAAVEAVAASVDAIPSGGSAGTPALRALGTTSTTAAAGDDSRFGTVADGGVTLAKLATDATAALAGKVRYRGAWAATTAYAVNDLITHHGEGLYLVTTAHTSGATFGLANLARVNGRRGVYDVCDYGAIGDNATNDTAAINAAVRAAVAGGLADGSYYAEVRFPPLAGYVVSSAPILGGVDLGSGLGVGAGNAQIPLPVIPSTGRKFVLSLTGGGPAGLPHWRQTVGQRAGSVIRSTLTGLVADGTWGPPAIIGGPTVYDDGGGFPFSNMLLRLDGLTIMAPYNPGIIGVDARDIAQIEVGSLSILADAGPAGSPALTVKPTNDLGIALRAPRNGNNDACVAASLGVEGFYYGVALGEHFTGLRIAVIYAQVALFLSGVGGASYHGATFGNLSIEACDIGLQCFDSDGGAFPLAVQTWSVESIGTWDLDDANGNILGTVQWNDAATAGTPKVRAGGRLTFLSQQIAARPGAKTAPALPASTTPLLNPFWRDAAVTISGGTVTGIAVDGQALGVTSGTVTVPSGKTITLTYSVAPTWKWTTV